MPSRSPSRSRSRPLFFRNARQLLTLAGPPTPRRGNDLRELGIIRDGAVLTAAGQIVGVGTTRALEAESRRLRAREVNCRGRVVMPGFIDSHTHLVFAGNRLDDYEQRSLGKTYEEIAGAGGGIGLSARLLRAASEAELVRQGARFLAQFAAHGTTTIEVKTGYGLDVAHELKMLEVIARLRKSTPLELVPTLLAAHALPPEYKGRAMAYVDAMVQKLIPAVAKKRLAEFIDCFCERGAFSADACRRVLKGGTRHGLTPRIHAEQLSRTGGSQLAVALGAASADHLDFVRDVDIRRLARSNVVATLLPGSNFHMGVARYAPARRLIDAGAIVALATDFNPGTSPTLNMQFILSLACVALRMTPAEAVSAATINAAYALRRAERLGSLERGKDADLIVMDTEDYREIPYYFAWNHGAMTVKSGRIVAPVKGEGRSNHTMME